jgi:hypothetical protein
VLLLALPWPVVENFGPALEFEPSMAESLCSFYLFFDEFKDLVNIG